jgi:hypothetical protein
MGNARINRTTALGIAFLIQFCTSLISGLLFNTLVDDRSAVATMTSITQGVSIAKLSVFLDLMTAVGIVWLAVLLFERLNRTGRVAAMTALALYIVEVVLLVFTAITKYSLIMCSTAPSLGTIGVFLLRLRDFAGALEMIPFGIGAILFYFLLFKSKALPAWIPLYGLITVIPILIGWSITAFGIAKPSFFIYAPYVPFELFIGIYILVKGWRKTAR